MAESLDLKLLRRIARHPTASFFEDLIQAESLQILDELFSRNSKVSIQKDENGNIIAHYKGDKDKTRSQNSIAYVSHMDHPAFLVTGHPKPAHVEVTMYGGLNSELMLKSRVDLCRFEKDKVIKERGTIIEELPEPSEEGHHRYLVRARNAHDFTFATLALPSLVVGKDDIIRGPALDDLASVATSIAALNQIAQEQLLVDVYVVLHRAEEIGFIGAYGVASSRIIPQDTFVYSIETSSYKARRNGKDPLGPVDTIAKVGGGVVIRTGDARTPAFDFAAVHLLREAAFNMPVRMEEENQHHFPYQQVRMYGGGCEGSLYYAMGYRTAGIILPLIAWHNNGVWEGEKRLMREGVHRDDFHGMTELMVNTARTLSDRPLLYTDLGRGDITPEHGEMVTKIKGLFEHYKGKGLLG